MNRPQLLRDLPKVDLHSHIAGTISVENLHRLAKKAGITIPDNVYAVESAMDFLAKLDVVASVLIEPEDFELITYEYLSSGARTSNLRHAEIFWNATLYPTQLFSDILAAIRSGAAAAESEFGISTLILPAICREQGPEVADQLLDLVLAHLGPDIAGIGLDGDELAAPPELFVDVFQRAGRAGLKRTAHVTYPPASRVQYCIDVLGCDRIDHGYYVLEDALESQAVADRQVPVTVCYSLTCLSRGWDLQTHPLKAMHDMGFNLILGTDDEAFVDTNIGNEYVRVCDGYELPMAEVTKLLHAGVTASWADDARKAELHAEIDQAVSAIPA
ncbi:putative Adenosine deaminase [metagenome]|uniref:Putative Adenosine deaminase n=1 Tax=metagenome TaxID=256318 RepID=A0A2P2C481_9ZZZZ